MTRPVLCAAGVAALAAILSAQAPEPASRRGAAAAAIASPASARAAPRRRRQPFLLPTFQKYCFECHGTKKPEGGSQHRAAGRARFSIDAHAAGVGKGRRDARDRHDAAARGGRSTRPTPNGRRRPRWIRDSLKVYETEHAGEPGRVTVRRLTSAEYAYAIRDLTGIDARRRHRRLERLGRRRRLRELRRRAVRAGREHRTLSRGGQAGRRSRGDRRRAARASIPTPARPASSCRRCNRINELYETKGFRVVSGEGGRPFGLERYGKALYVAWYYKHRAALGDPKRDDSRARREGRDHRPLRRSHLDGGEQARTPGIRRARRSTAGRRCRRRPPTSPASLAKARAGCDEIQQVPDHLAELVLRARRSRRRRRRRREPAVVRRRDAEGGADAALHLWHRPTRRRPRPRRSRRRPVPRRSI